MECGEGCKSCNITENYDFYCTECDTGLLYDQEYRFCSSECREGYVNIDGVCNPECPTGYGPDINRECQSCDNSGCTKCKWTHNGYQCLECDAGLISTSQSSNYMNYTCDATCDSSNENLCMYEGKCVEKRGYFDYQGNWYDWPSTCTSCEYIPIGSQVFCNECHEGYCLNRDYMICTEPIFTEFSLQPTYNANTGAVKYECADQCATGYLASVYKIWFQCDSTQFPQCNDPNCEMYDFDHYGRPFCVSCAEGYIPDLFNGYRWK